jgi:hypothetical protein
MLSPFLAILIRLIAIIVLTTEIEESLDHYLVLMGHRKVHTDRNHRTAPRALLAKFMPLRAKSLMLTSFVLLELGISVERPVATFTRPGTHEHGYIVLFVLMFLEGILVTKPFARIALAHVAIVVGLSGSFSFILRAVLHAPMCVKGILAGEGSLFANVAS